MRKKIVRKKRGKSRALSPFKQWDKEVKEQVPPGQMIPEHLAQKAPDNTASK